MMKIGKKQFFVLFLAISLFAFSVNADLPGTCKNPGGGNYCGAKSPDNCYCDSVCTNYGDCCSDYSGVCGSSGSTSGVSESANSGKSEASVGVKGSIVVYEGFLDAATCYQISGWAWDTAKPNDAIYVNLFYDGSSLNKIASIPAGDYRADLETAGKGNGKHAFGYYMPEKLKDGYVHTIHAQFSGTTTNLWNSPLKFDSANCKSLNPLAPNPPFNLKVETGIDGKFYAHLSWLNDNGNWFYIYRNKNEGPFQFLAKTEKKEYSDSFELPNSDVKFGYYVTALNSYGESNPSNIVYVYPSVNNEINCAAYDYNCDETIDLSDANVIGDLWKSGTQINIDLVTSLAKKCSVLGNYIGSLWQKGYTQIPIDEVTGIGASVKKCSLSYAKETVICKFDNLKQNGFYTCYSDNYQGLNGDKVSNCSIDLSVKPNAYNCNATVAGKKGQATNWYSNECKLVDSKPTYLDFQDEVVYFECNVGMDACLDNPSNYWDQETEKCYPGFSKEIIKKSCKDPDEGDNIYKAAHTFGFRSTYADERDRRIRTGGKDACSYNTLTEHYCDIDGYIQTVQHVCTNGCEEGACIKDSKLTASIDKPYTVGTAFSISANGYASNSGSDSLISGYKWGIDPSCSEVKQTNGESSVSSYVYVSTNIICASPGLKTFSIAFYTKNEKITDFMKLYVNDAGSTTTPTPTPVPPTQPPTPAPTPASVTTPNPSTQAAGSCEGSCGGKSKSGNCYCDDYSVTNAGDYCGDISVKCPQIWNNPNNKYKS